MKNTIFILTMIFAAFLFSVSAVAMPIYVTPLNGTNHTRPNTALSYIFNLTSDSSCSDVINSDTSSLKTNPQGVAVYNINISSLNSIPKYLCEYQGNQTLRQVHIFPNRIIIVIG